MMLKTYIPQILIISGSILTIIGGLIAFIRQHDSQKNIANLLQQNKTLSETINNNLIGADSYGSVHPLSIIDKNEEAYILYFENLGNYPLYDVNVEMWNPDDFSDKNRSDRATVDDLKKHISFEIGNVPVHGGKSIGQLFRLNNGEKRKLNISINARNGSFSQLLRIIKKDDTLLVAQKVNAIARNGAKPKILLNKASDNFPKDNSGAILWE